MVARSASPPDVVRAKRLEIVDDDGKVQAVLESTPSGPRFEMRDGENPVIRAEVYNGTGALIQLLEPGGGLRVQLNANVETGDVQFYGIGGDREPKVASAARLAVDPDGPSLRLDHADATEPRQRRRVLLRGHKDGANLLLYGGDGDLGNPLADLTAEGRAACLGLDAVHEYELTGKPHTDPALDLSSTVEGGGRLAIYDEQMDLVHEVPETIAGFTQRLKERLVQATADALAAEGREISSSDLFEAYCCASDIAQGAVGQMVTELAEAEGAVVRAAGAPGSR